MQAQEARDLIQRLFGFFRPIKVSGLVLGHKPPVHVPPGHLPPDIYSPGHLPLDIYPLGHIPPKTYTP